MNEIDIKSLKTLSKHLKNSYNIIEDIIKRNESPVEPKPASTKTRKPNPIWDKLCEIFKLSPTTRGELSSMGRICRDLKAKDATPTRIEKIVWAYKNMWPGAACTEFAITKNWDRAKAWYDENKHLYSVSSNGIPAPDGDRKIDYAN